MERAVRAVVALLAISCLTLLAACQSGAGSDERADPSGSAAATDTFPVTVEHAFGSTTIEEKPTRIATWGFGSTDAVLALGVVPVAIPQQLYGGDENGLLPWIGEKLDELGGEAPAMLSNPDGSTVPYEEIAEAAPDVILANYSGITQEQYDTLTKIAPVVAYPDQPWTTPWRDVVTTVGQVMGQSEQAAELISSTEQEIADRAKEYPQLQGKTVAAVWDTPDGFYVYRAADPRVEFLTDLGLTSAPSVDELATGDSSFYYTLSTERVSELTSDVLLVYADSQQSADTFLARPYAKSMEQVQQDHVALAIGQEFVAAVSPPTVLSLTWGLDSYLEALAEAV